MSKNTASHEAEDDGRCSVSGGSYLRTGELVEIAAHLSDARCEYVMTASGASNTSLAQASIRNSRPIPT